MLWKVDPFATAIHGLESNAESDLRYMLRIASRRESEQMFQASVERKKGCARSERCDLEREWKDTNVVIKA